MLLLERISNNGKGVFGCGSISPASKGTLVLQVLVRFAVAKNNTLNLPRHGAVCFVLS